LRELFQIVWNGNNFENPTQTYNSATVERIKDYYQILEVQSDAKLVEIKSNYQRKILELHPDKNALSFESDQCYSQFQDVKEAWEVLRDDNLRAAYDLKRKDKISKQDMPLYAEVDLDDMEFHSEDLFYYLECRCGGEGFKVFETQLEEGIDRTICGTCSLMIKIHYEKII